MNDTVQIILGFGLLIFLVFCGISILVMAYSYYREVTDIEWYKDEYRRMKNLYEKEKED